MFRFLAYCIIAERTPKKNHTLKQKLVNISNINCKIQFNFSFSLLVFLFGQVLLRRFSASSTLCFLISVSSSLRWFPLSLICCDSALFNFLCWIYFRALPVLKIPHFTFCCELASVGLIVFFSRYRYPFGNAWKHKLCNDVFHSFIFGRCFRSSGHDVSFICFYIFNLNVFQSS